MRPFKPAPKNASANRIRERYLHQLGLQRGAPLTGPPRQQADNHVVVVLSGLPSLPEDRATTTTEHVMESHDFSICSRHSQRANASDAGGESADGSDDGGSDSGSAGRAAADPASSDARSQCSGSSTLSLSPAAERAAGESLTSMALARPTALRRGARHRPAAAEPAPPPPNRGTDALPPSPWRDPAGSLSKPPSVPVDSAEHRGGGGGGNDHDSVSSAGTSTTAESSLAATAAMVSWDWGSVPQGGGGESPGSAPGVHFQCGHPRLLGGSIGGAAPNAGGHCATASSLAHALNRFNIDSDCETIASSVASHDPMAEDHYLTMDEDDDDDACSVASRSSAGSATAAEGGLRHAPSSQSLRTAARKKKIGKTQRLMDRAAAHERILRIRSDRSQTMRASVVHSQRMGCRDACMSPPPSSPTAGDDAERSLSEDPESPPPLVHMRHSARGLSRHLSMSGDLGRTPTASNCNSDLRRLKEMGLGPPPGGVRRLCTPPAGVHVFPNRLAQSARSQETGCPSAGPLGCQPRLASRIPTPPPKPADKMPPGMLRAGPSGASSSDPSAGEWRGSPSRHARQATIDDVMDVAMTLSRLGGGTPDPVPGIR